MVGARALRSACRGAFCDQQQMCSGVSRRCEQLRAVLSNCLPILPGGRAIAPRTPARTGGARGGIWGA
eukprot:10661784-Alexandrium_andersonii.AAC.1